ncbi:MAG: pyridoxal phosphate-dependent aminotransferase [Betaproteobacteria bacterium]|nr:MAG: pyridoxal phosphate-dependent aminotransferase [Betaproteobacteria bacterium]
MTGNVAGPKPSLRAQAIAPFHVMEILARARELERQGRSIIHMEIGEPDFETPEPVLAAARRALGERSMHYTPALGLPELRQAIAAHYRLRYGVAIDWRRIIVTSGSSGALLLALGVLVDPGARVLLADPGYPANRHFVRVLNGEPVGIAVDASSHYQLSPGTIAAHWDANTVATLIASPSNPTGTLISHEALQAIHREVAARGGTLLVDEIYHGLTYGTEPRTALEIAEDIFVINSFSKYFGMTGWRIGWLVAPPGMVDAIERMAQNVYLAVSTPAQYAALAAFGPDNLAILEQRRSVLRERRDYLVEALRRLDFDVPVVPEGAFYVYANCARLTGDSFDLGKRLLEEAGVAVTPGVDFGSHRAREHVRFAYTTRVERLREAVVRMERFLAARRFG